MIPNDLNRLDKTCVFEFLCNAHANYKKENSFSINFPELYKEFKSISWQEDLPFLELL